MEKQKYKFKEKKGARILEIYERNQLQEKYCLEFRENQLFLKLLDLSDHKFDVLILPKKQNFKKMVFTLIFEYLSLSLNMNETLKIIYIRIALTLITRNAKFMQYDRVELRRIFQYGFCDPNLESESKKGPIPMLVKYPDFDVEMLL